MLDYKRYVKLKTERKILHKTMPLLKAALSYYLKFGDKHKIAEISTRDKIRITKIQINYLNDILRLHKILYKQYLHNQEFFRNI